MKTGYSIRTWKLRVFCPEQNCLQQTETFYQEVLDFYYKLLLNREELWGLGTFQIQRELEKLTVAGRDGRQPDCPLPYEKVPVYFRRSAINKAAATVKSILSLRKDDETHNFPQQIQASVTFFKGMYSDLTQNSVALKLWNGQKWIWTSCNLKGRDFPADGELLSPTLVKEGKWYMLNIPVKQENADARTAKERMAAGASLCSVRFTNTDMFAMCCVLDKEGRQTAAKSIRGGDAYRHACRQLLAKIEKSKVYTDKDNSHRPNRKYFQHLKNLSDHYAHKASREIVDFCLREKAEVIILPSYNEDFTKMTMAKSGNFSPMHLSTRIRSLLQYKAWAAGIIVLETTTAGMANRCSICGGTIRKKDKLFLCENGHQGNRFLNDAKNLGHKCQESFRKNSGK